MPTLESIDYERFSLEEPNTPTLTLDEAVKRSKELRRSDSSNFYRIEAVDKNATTFRVEVVPVASAYAEFLARITKTMARYARVGPKI